VKLFIHGYMLQHATDVSTYLFYIYKWYIVNKMCRTGILASISSIWRCLYREL
jgi:hypothetical protein